MMMMMMMMMIDEDDDTANCNPLKKLTCRSSSEKAPKRRIMINAERRKTSNRQTETQTGSAPARALTFILIVVINFLLSISSTNGQMADVIAIKEGADLDLSCPIVVPNEDIIISWTCDNEPANIKSSRIYITESGKLRIRSAKVGDSCNYRCEAADGYGTLSVIIKVIIVDKSLLEQLAKQNQTSGLHSNRLLQQQQQQQQQLLQKHSQQQTLRNSVKGTPLEPIGGGSNGEEGNLNRLTQLEAGGSDSNEGGKETLDEQKKGDLEIQVKPEVIRVDKNRTFTLECKVKHAPNSMVPQIIWLKEFIGLKPDSLSEAHERNLVLIDDIYFHSLNWPRSITYSRHTASTNSALLVRQTNYVHSGRYLCFAGYPPFMMSSNLSLTNESTTVPKGSSSMKQFRYRMAMASVKVDDEEGERQHKFAMGARNNQLDWISNDSDYETPRSAKSVILSLFTTNTWLRNLTFLLVLGCALLYFARFALLHLRESSGSDQQTARRPKGINSNTTNNNNNGGNDPSSNLLYPDDSQQLAIKHLNPRQQNIPPTRLTLLATSANDNNTALKEKIETLHQSSANGLSSSEKTENDDHLYSEIGERNNISLQATQQTQLDNQHYKVPNVNRNGN